MQQVQTLTRDQISEPLRRQFLDYEPATRRGDVPNDIPTARKPPDTRRLTETESMTSPISELHRPHVFGSESRLHRLQPTIRQTRVSLPIPPPREPLPAR